MHMWFDSTLSAKRRALARWCVLAGASVCLTVVTTQAIPIRACCCAVQIPLQLGAVFVAAAQHNPKSPVTQAAMSALNMLMLKAWAAGTASNPASIQQQLQQSSVLQELPAVLAAMTAELQAETAALATGTWDAASGDIQHFTAANALHSRFAAVMSLRRFIWEEWEAVPTSSASAGWLWGSSGHAVTVMQLATAGLRFASSIVQHVLPAVCERAPQHAAALSMSLQFGSQFAGLQCAQIVGRLCVLLEETQQQGQGKDAGTQLLQSPHLLPCVAAVVVMSASHLSRSVAEHCSRVKGSTASASGKSSSGSQAPSNSGAAAQPDQGVQCAPGSNAGSTSRSSSSGEGSDTLTACQMQLQQLLGLTPEVIDWAMQLCGADSAGLYQQLKVALDACYERCIISEQLLRSNSTESEGSEEQQLVWQFELRLWRLLPTVLLPCASSLLLPGAPHQTQKHGEGLVPLLLDVSTSALQLSGQLHTHFNNYGMASARAPQAACVQGCLIALLRLTGKLLYQQPLTPASTTAASPGSQRSSGSTSTGRPCPLSCARQLLLMFVHLAHNSQYPGWNPGSNDSSTSSSLSDSPTDAAGASCSNAAVALPPLASTFVEFVTALEATLRATSQAMQSSVISTDMLADMYPLIGSVCSALLLSGDEHDSMLMQPMGLRGPAALAKEQQQLYSLLSTILKLRYCVQDDGQRCLGEQMVATCCLAAGHAAVALLKMALGPAGAGGSPKPDPRSHSQAEAAAAVAAQQPALSYLPSLVIFGRCLLQWADQLQQQAPQLVLLEPGNLQQSNTLLLEHGAACVCVPGLREGSTVKPGQRLESLVATVGEWMGSIDSPAHAQLAAAGCSPQHLQQQLVALLTSQQGTQQGLTDASLTALVQQLQATGAMLSSISVPHICNNPACANLSGPTEVRLVSGRSCICAGCRVARYCGRACQRAAWKQHKPVCKALAATSATAAT